MARSYNAVTSDKANLVGHWQLDPEILHLNHGSFGACPVHVLETQARLRTRLERDPLSFYTRELEGLMDAARQELGAFLGAPPECLAFIPNATTGVNAVLRSLPFRAGDEILTTDHEYNACRNALDFVAHRAGAEVIVAPIPFPLESPDEVFAAVMDRVTPRTRLALIDHITSPSALILPVERIVQALTERGIDTLIDGAHGPGMLPLNLERIGAAYYAGNCHKWLCAPKGSALLYVRSDRQARVRPLTISHGANSPRTDCSRFQLEFDWTGTHDPTAYLCVPAAIRFLRSLLPGGWPALRKHNRELALEGRRILCKTLEIAPPCPVEMIGSMAALVLAAGTSAVPPGAGICEDPLEKVLFERYRILAPVICWPQPPLRILRISAQIYNHVGQYRQLADALRESWRPSGSSGGA